jgi:hypothetical protein
MDETQDLALRALRDLLADPDRTDLDELLAANRALLKAIETGEPMTPRNARIVAEYLREAGWSEGAIGAATAQAGAYAGTHCSASSSKPAFFATIAGLDGRLLDRYARRGTATGWYPGEISRGPRSCCTADVSVPRQQRAEAV